MKTIIVSKQIRGKGRGKTLGFPTINLKIPSNFTLAEGVYGVWVTINKKRLLGALHFGPVPTFHEKKKNLEVFLIDAGKIILPAKLAHQVIVEVIKKIRGIKTFSSADGLISQISQDVDVIRKLFSHLH